MVANGANFPVRAGANPPRLRLGRDHECRAPRRRQADDLEAREAAHLPNIQEERRRAILAFIDRHLDDPEFGVAHIARVFGMSTRSVHKLFDG
jgi:AraC-like DNA-binding protein